MSRCLDCRSHLPAIPPVVTSHQYIPASGCTVAHKKGGDPSRCGNLKCPDGGEVVDPEVERTCKWHREKEATK